MTARPRSARILPLAFALAAGAAALALAAPPASLGQRAVDVLRRRCWQCHGGSKVAGLDLRTRAAALKGGEHGKGLVPGQPEESPVYLYVAGKGTAKMPPGGALPAAEQGLLREWIAAGAPWPGEAAGSEGDVWWSLRPLRAPRPPRVRNRAWVRNPVDAFVLARLEARGLSPAPPAAPRELIRRLTFDLWGLPPAPEDVEAFAHDPSPAAYEALVDRLLASPRYGERWARHWLDVARFAESQGYERDKIRDHAWRYRDWVIGALNRDLPYDRFVHEQVAGDVLPDATPESTVATGFLVAGPWDEVGALQASMVGKARAREEELEDMVGAVGQSFLGLTVNCARCHDHKFDPIPQRDYFRFQAAFAAVRHGDRDITTETQRAEANAALRPLRAEALQLQERVAELRARGTAAAAARVAPPPDPTLPPAPAPALRWSFDGGYRDTVRGLPLEPFGGPRLLNGRLVLDGKDDAARVNLPIPLTEKTLEAWVALATLDQRGGGVLTVEDTQGRVFDSVAYGERVPRRWLAGSTGFQRTRDVDAPAESIAGRPVHLAITYASDGTIALFRNGEPYGAPYRPAGPDSSPRTYGAGRARVLLGLRHSQGALPGDGRWLQGEIDEVRVYDRALTAGEVRASFRAGPPAITDADVRAALAPAEREELGRAEAATARLRERIEALAQPVLAYCANAAPGAAPTVRRLNRGDVTQPAEPVAPGGLACLPGLPGDLGLAPDAPDAERRRRFAAWLTAAGNPLTPRVAANRVWQHHFGRGLVGTPNDFGISGEAPSHPELLDWLAATFRQGSFPGRPARPWSLKELHRLLVLSNTYRQGGRHDPRAAARDAENRLLWRMAPRRLTAEEVRDAMLAVSGQLNLGEPGREGGPGFRPFKVTISNTHFYTHEDRAEPEYNRRSIYRCVVNSGGVPLLEALDCPDPSVKTPRRGTTTTPLQALTLLNNSFVLRQAREMGRRLEAGAADPAARADLAYRLALARPPTPAERERAAAFLREHGAAAFCRALLNSSEFVYVR